MNEIAGVPASFADLPLQDPSAGPSTASQAKGLGEPWEAPEGIAVQPLYTAGDLEGLDALDT